MAGPAANPLRSPVPPPSTPRPLCSAEALMEKDRFQPYENFPFLGTRSEYLILKLAAEEDEEREIREGSIRGLESTGRSMRRRSLFKAASENPRKEEEEEEVLLVFFYYINHLSLARL